MSNMLKILIKNTELHILKIFAALYRFCINIVTVLIIQNSLKISNKVQVLANFLNKQKTIFNPGKLACILTYNAGVKFAWLQENL